MKRLAHPECSFSVEFSENVIPTLVVENKDFLRRLVNDLYLQVNGEGGAFVLSEEYEPIEISKHMELITQWIPFEINRKHLLSKICAALEKTAVNEQHFLRSQELLAEIERYMEALTFDFCCDLVYEKLTIPNLIKSVGVCVSADYENELEKVLDYMQLVREFDKEKVFVFVHMRSFFADASIAQFLKEAAARKFQVLLIDNCDNVKLPLEVRYTIDADLCEF